MTRYTVVLLRRPANAPALSEAAADALQQKHLDHLTAMKERGAMLTAGPFRDQPDDSLRGMCLYRTNLEETRALAESDPMVKADWLGIEVFTWLVPEGELPA